MQLKADHILNIPDQGNMLFIGSVCMNLFWKSKKNYGFQGNIKNI